ncbi:hypothetical protein BTVI_153022 [Pitangus sulphuratus]|nr:hypothetical protein BTVI_153022 [Pitangus sulphuratus]
MNFKINTQVHISRLQYAFETAIYEILSYAKRVGVISAREKAPGRTQSSLPVPEEAYRKVGEGLFTGARMNDFKLKKSRFRVAIRKKFITVRVSRHWKRFPGQIVDVPSLEVFKARLDGTLSNLVQWKVSLPMTRGLELDDL